MASFAYVSKAFRQNREHRMVLCRSSLVQESEVENKNETRPMRHTHIKTIFSFNRLIGSLR